MAHKTRNVHASLTDVALNQWAPVIGEKKEKLPFYQGLKGALIGYAGNAISNGFLAASLFGPFGLFALPATVLTFAGVSAGASYLADVRQDFFQTKRTVDKGKITVIASLNEKIDTMLGGINGTRKPLLKTIFGLAAGGVVGALTLPTLPIIGAAALIGGVVGGVTSWLTDVRRKSLQMAMPVPA
jgi:hypothetical protein